MLNYAFYRHVHFLINSLDYYRVRIMKAEYKDYYRKMGMNIAYYRRMQNLTQEALGAKVNIDQTHMSKIEMASIGISLDMLFAIAEALNVQPNKFLEFRD